MHYWNLKVWCVIIPPVEALIKPRRGRGWYLVFFGCIFHEEHFYVERLSCINNLYIVWSYMYIGSTKTLKQCSHSCHNIITYQFNIVMCHLGYDSFLKWCLADKTLNKLCAHAEDWYCVHTCISWYTAQGFSTALIISMHMHFHLSDWVPSKNFRSTKLMSAPINPVKPIQPWFFNPIALRIAKTQWKFDHSECSMVKHEFSISLTISYLFISVKETDMGGQSTSHFAIPGPYNCTVAFMSECTSLGKCKQSCKSMGSAK